MLIVQALSGLDTRQQQTVKTTNMRTAFYFALVAVVVAVAFVLLGHDGVKDMEWKEIRIGVWVARLGLMKPLYDFLAIYGPEINTMVREMQTDL